MLAWLQETLLQQPDWLPWVAAVVFGFVGGGLRLAVLFLSGARADNSRFKWLASIIVGGGAGFVAWALTLVAASSEDGFGIAFVVLTLLAGLVGPEFLLNIANKTHGTTTGGTGEEQAAQQSATEAMKTQSEAFKESAVAARISQHIIDGLREELRDERNKLSDRTEANAKLREKIARLESRDEG